MVLERGGAGSLHGSFPRRYDDEDRHRGHRALRARGRATPAACRSASPGAQGKPTTARSPGPWLDGHLSPDGFVLADKACDAEWTRAMIKAQDAVPIMPDRRGATALHAFSRDLYRLRNQVERFFKQIQTVPAHRNTQ